MIFKSISITLVGASALAVICSYDTSRAGREKAAQERRLREAAEKARGKATIEFSSHADFRTTTGELNGAGEMYLRVPLRFPQNGDGREQRIHIQRKRTPDEIKRLKAEYAKSNKEGRARARREGTVHYDREVKPLKYVIYMDYEISDKILKRKKWQGLEEMGKTIMTIMPPEKSAREPWYYLMLEELAALPAGTYEFVVNVFTPSKLRSTQQGLSTIKIRIDPKAVRARWRKFKDRALIGRDLELKNHRDEPALIAKMKNSAEKKFGGPVAKISISYKNWRIERHERSGRILRRYLHASFVVFRKQEKFKHCVKTSDVWLQTYLDGRYGPLRISGDEPWQIKRYDVHCAAVGFKAPRETPATGTAKKAATRVTEKPAAKTTIKKNPDRDKKTVVKTEIKKVVKKAPPKKLPPPGPEAVILAGKIWQKCGKGANYAGGTCIGKSSKAPFLEARAYCESLSLSGRTWRLPTSVELEKLLKKDAAGAKIDGTKFPGTAAAAYWTADIYQGQAVYVVDFYLGLKYPFGPTNTAHTRCIAVR